MKTLRSIQICALLLGMGFLPAKAGDWIDLGVNESPQAPTDFTPTGLEVEVGGMGSNAGEFNVIVTNVTDKPVSAQLQFEVVVAGGKIHHVWVPIEVAPGATIFTARYLVAVESADITTGPTNWIGVIDSPDPILSIRQPPPDDGGGGGVPFN